MTTDADSQSGAARVTVLIATYNRASTLGGAIESVLRQSYPNVDLVVIDDGSTDGTADVLEAYRANPRVRTVALARNRGVTAAKNAGLDALAPDTAYFCFLDSDDVLLPDGIRVLVAALEASGKGYSQALGWALDRASGTRTGRTTLGPGIVTYEDALCGRFEGDFEHLARASALKGRRFDVRASGGEASLWWAMLREGPACLVDDVVASIERGGTDRVSRPSYSPEGARARMWAYAAVLAAVGDDMRATCPNQFGSLNVEMAKWAALAGERRRSFRGARNGLRHAPGRRSLAIAATTLVPGAILRAIAARRSARGHAPVASRRRPRIAYVVTALEVGGAEQQARLLALAFAKRGWDVAVISMVPLEFDESALKSAGVTVLSLDMHAGIPSPIGLLKLVRWLRAWRPDVVQSLMVHANLLARLAHPLVPAPVIVSSIRTPNEGGRWRYLASRLTNRLADATTAVSQDSIDAAVAHGSAPGAGIRLIPNGIDVRRFTADPAARDRLRQAFDCSGAFVWLAVGRLTEAKGYSVLVAAMARVVENVDQVRLLIAGPGPLEDTLRMQIEALGLQDHVTLLGLRDDIPDLMSAADGLVLPSLWEGLPMVLLEAGAAGLPAVATSVGANAEVIVDRETGFIVPPGEPAALARTMQEVIGLTPDERLRVGQAARSRVTLTYDLEAMADRWQALYNELLSLRRPASLR